MCSLLCAPHPQCHKQNGARKRLAARAIIIHVHAPERLLQSLRGSLRRPRARKPCGDAQSPASCPQNGRAGPKLAETPLTAIKIRTRLVETVGRGRHPSLHPPSCTRRHPPSPAFTRRHPPSPAVTCRHPPSSHPHPTRPRSFARPHPPSPALAHAPSPPPRRPSPALATLSHPEHPITPLAPTLPDPQLPPLTPTHEDTLASESATRNDRSEPRGWSRAPASSGSRTPRARAACHGKSSLFSASRHQLASTRRRCASPFGHASMQIGWHIATSSPLCAKTCAHRTS